MTPDSDYQHLADRSVQVRGLEHMQSLADRHVSASSGDGMPHGETIQRAFGRHSIAGTRVQRGGAATQANDALGSKAFTFGDRVAFREHAPSLWLAAHEAAHVVQQQAGVQQFSSRSGGRRSDPLERQADRVADAVVAGRSAEDLLSASVSRGAHLGAAPQPTLQCYTVEKDTDTKDNIILRGSERKVSENRKMVLYGSSQVGFYASTAQIADSNQKLKQANSFIRFTSPKLSYSKQYRNKKNPKGWSRDTKTVKLGDQTLYQVRPYWVDRDEVGLHGSLDEHKDIHNANVKRAKKLLSKPMKNRGTDFLELWYDCGMSSAGVMGLGKLEREAFYEDGKSHRRYTASTATPTVMSREIYDTVLAGFLKLNPKYIVDSHKPVYSKNKDRVLRFQGFGGYRGFKTKAGYFAMSQEGRDAFDRGVGINRYAAPEVGQGFTIATEDMVPGFKKGRGAFRYHWAGVVARDGSDRVTLEAEARSTDGFDKSLKSWKFHMYGMGKGQSFHEKMLKSDKFGNYATTLQVRPPTKKESKSLETPKKESKLSRSVSVPVLENLPLPIPLPMTAPVPKLDNDDGSTVAPAPAPAPMPGINGKGNGSLDEQVTAPMPTPRRALTLRNLPLPQVGRDHLGLPPPTDFREFEFEKRPKVSTPKRKLDKKKRSRGLFSHGKHYYGAPRLTGLGLLRMTSKGGVGKPQGGMTPNVPKFGRTLGRTTSSSSVLTSVRSTKDPKQDVKGHDLTNNKKRPQRRYGPQNPLELSQDELRRAGAVRRVQGLYDGAVLRLQQGYDPDAEDAQDWMATWELETRLEILGYYNRSSRYAQSLIRVAIRRGVLPRALSEIIG